MAAVEPVLTYLRYRVVDRTNLTASGFVEIVSDLAHLHQSTWTIRSMQQGAPGAVAIGDFTVRLHPPGSDGFWANLTQYQKLFPGSGEGYRVEAYIGETAALSKPTYAGIITSVTLSTENGGLFELNGHTDEWLASAQRTYPGEILHSNAYDTVTILNTFLGHQVVNLTDQFNPYTSANYTSTSLPGGVNGAWTATTDANGINSNVVTSSTGTGAVLINKTSFAVGDTLNTQIVECVGRLRPNGTSAVNAGKMGLGFSASSANASDSIVCYVTAKWNSTTSRYDLDAHIDAYVATVLSSPVTYTNVLTSVDDPDGWIPLNLQILQQFIGGVGTIRFIVNGSPVNTIGTGPTYGLNPIFPMLVYNVPVSGSSPAYYTNLLGGTRLNLSNSYFPAGAQDSPTHKFRANQALPPTFLDMWTICATLEGWYWRFNVQTAPNAVAPWLGSVDIGVAPGTDHSADIVFEEGRNALWARQQGNADIFGSDLQFNGYADSSSGGIHYGRNIAAMVKYGWLSGVGMSLSVQDYAGLQRQGAQVAANRGTPGASYVVQVLRDPATADKFRELDSITLHYPSLGLYNKKLLVVSYTFAEGQATQTLTLGQYGVADLISAQRFVPGATQMAGLFKGR